jgi:membrane protease YdiL (CAAX protease family)
MYGGKMNTRNQFGLFVLAFVILFVLFRGIAILLANMDWTLMMLLTCVIVVAGSALARSLLRKTSFAASFREIGFGIPDGRVLGIAAILSVLMVAFIPLYGSITGTVIPLQQNWSWILLGVITGVGITEETLFRGFVFNYLREGRTFWRAATVSIIFFGVMHLLLLLWLPLPIAIAAILLAIIAAYPTAYLFENGNRTIWPSALMHSAALATNLFVIPESMTVSFSLVWIGVVVIFLFMVFALGKLFNVRRPVASAASVP